MRAYFHLAYRQTEGVVKAHARSVQSIPNYSTISRHVNKLDIEVDEHVGNDIVISLEATSEEVHDSDVLKKLVRRASENNGIQRVLADGAYDSKKNFRYLARKGIEAAIKVRRNSSGKAMGCYPRKLAVLQQLTDFDRWKSSVSYNQR
jgi:hypothetical protein